MHNHITQLSKNGSIIIMAVQKIHSGAFLDLFKELHFLLKDCLCRNIASFSHYITLIILRLSEHKIIKHKSVTIDGHFQNSG